MLRDLRRVPRVVTRPAGPAGPLIVARETPETNDARSLSRVRCPVLEGGTCQYNFHAQVLLGSQVPGGPGGEGRSRPTRSSRYILLAWYLVKHVNRSLKLRLRVEHKTCR